METVVRIAVIYLFVLVALRIMGKREFGQLSALELVTLLLIPEIVSQSLNVSDASVTNALVGVATLLVLVFLTSMATHKSQLLEHMVSGQACLLAHHGRLVTDNLDRERVSVDELFAEIHKAGLDRLEQVKWAVLEADGRIAIVPFDAEQAGRSDTKTDLPL